MFSNNPIDALLNRVTMYRLALYALSLMLMGGVVMSFFGLLPFAPQNLIYSGAVLSVACWIFNWILAKFFGVPTNAESSYITGLILALIITPPAFTAQGAALLLFAALFAMASKYIITWRGKLIFNPAALAVVLTAFVFGQYASWWVAGNIPMLAFVLIGGLLIVRKAQRFDLVLAFVAAALVSILATGAAPLTLGGITQSLLHTSILFFALIMLTEPTTTPPTRGLRILYGILVGVLFSPAVHVGDVYSTPELALVVGNIFSFAISPKVKTLLSLKEKRRIGTNIWELIFDKPSGFIFVAGQYMEWTLATTGDDTRGNRRYFTLASSPTEREVRLGVRTQPEGEYMSTFKRHLIGLNPGDIISAGQLTGDFTLPHDPQQKLAFIAGGIGITPMRSMLKYLADKGERRDITLLYSSRFEDDIVYRDVLDEAAQKLGIKIKYVVTDEKNSPYAGLIDAEMIRTTVPDFAERTFYISGTRAMTISLESTLHQLGVPRQKIKVDFFPGFV